MRQGRYYRIGIISLNREECSYEYYFVHCSSDTVILGIIVLTFLSIKEKRLHITYKHLQASWGKQSSFRYCVKRIGYYTIILLKR